MGCQKNKSTKQNRNIEWLGSQSTTLLYNDIPFDLFDTLQAAAYATTLLALDF